MKLTKNLNFLLLSVPMLLFKFNLIKSQSVSIPVPQLQGLIMQSFQNWRSVMPKGSTKNGIPILDPFVVPFNIPIKIPNLAYASSGYFELVLSKLTFTGLSTFVTRSLTLDPLGRDMSFENYVGNMSASSDYTLNYYFTEIFPFPISQGSAYGAIYGADLKGSGTVLPTLGNWFKLLTVSMTFSFEHLDVRISPIFPLLDADKQKSIENAVYDGIQQMQPNLSSITTTTYSRTVELKLS